MINHLESTSLLLVYIAMAVLAVSLLAYTFELSRVASVGKDAAETSRLHTIGTWLLAVAVLVLFTGVLLRGIAAQRVTQRQTQPEDPGLHRCVLMIPPWPQQPARGAVQDHGARRM